VSTEVFWKQVRVMKVSKNQIVFLFNYDLETGSMTKIINHLKIGTTFNNRKSIVLYIPSKYLKVQGMG